MTFDDYNTAIARIHTELQQIADRTVNQAFVGSANAKNPMFVELMQRHVQLTKLSSELTERMISLMKQDALGAEGTGDIFRG